MENEPAILHSLAIDNGQIVEVFDPVLAKQLIGSEQLGWVHLDGTNPSAPAILETHSATLDGLTIDALFSEETRPRASQFDKGLLIVLRGVNLNDSAAPEDMISLRLWLDKYCLISVQRRPLKAITDTYHSLLEHHAPKSTGEILVLMVTRLFFRMQPTFSELGDQIEDLEDIFIENPASISNRQIVQLRKKIMAFRRYLAPQKQAIAFMLESDIPWLDKHSKRQLRESLETVTRHLENLDSFRERAQILSDELAHFHAGKMNQNMYILSLIAAIFLPLTFLPSLLGVNIGGIPGADYGSAFALFCGLLFTIMLIQIWIFRRLKWL